MARFQRAAILPVMPPGDLLERLRRTCRDRAAATAVHNLSDGRSLLFSELLDQSTALGRALTGAGVEAGSSVVTLVGNHPIFFPVLAACMDLGAAIVPMGEATDAEARSVVERSGAAAIITDRPLPLNAVREVMIGDGIRLLSLRDNGTITYGTSVMLKLTSGSTDVPKAAIAHEQHLINDGSHVIQAMGIRPDDVNLACIPLSHSYAIGNIVMPLLLQGTAVALRQSFKPSQFVADVESSGATVFPGVPFMFERLRALDVERLPSRLRLLVTAGARADPTTVHWFEQRYGGKVHSFYGSSETGGITYDDSADVSDPLHVGRAMPETRVEIRDADATGTGRIFVAGTAVASGYAHEDSVGTGFADGGFMTGDLGYRDEQGRLVLTGRVSLVINVAGRKVDPSEVERVLVDLPEVVDARVMGASCNHRGQQLVAFVIAKIPMTSVTMRQRCAKVLSPHKIPRRFIFVDHFPVDSRGKMDRRALEAMASGVEG
jgi:acyl-CoA synthetase (AMP-forming)/AMP-acid ligase II